MRLIEDRQSFRFQLSDNTSSYHETIVYEISLYKNVFTFVDPFTAIAIVALNYRELDNR